MSAASSTETMNKKVEVKNKSPVTVFAMCPVPRTSNMDLVNAICLQLVVHRPMILAYHNNKVKKIAK